MSLASIVLGAPQWLWPAAVLAVGALAVLAWAYRQAPARRTVCWICALLKVAAIALLVVCLIEPLFSGSRPRPGANLFLLLADNSQSMQIRDQGTRQTRAQLLKQQLVSRSNWQTRLGQDFDVRRYSFDHRLHSVSDFATLTLAGQGSSLGAALQGLASRYRNRPVAGVLLLTDGNATDRWDEVEWSTLPPIYPVLIGQTGPERDLSVSSVSVSQTNFEESPVTIRAEITARGYDGQQLVAQLLDESGKQVEEQTLLPSDAGRPLSVRFQVRPEEPGISLFRVRASAASEVKQFDRPERSREATLSNNDRLVVVDRGGGPYRILYVSGRPNWEFKFLRRAVEPDEEIQLIGLIRMAKREPKFEFLGRTGESTNPLFRGFDNQADEQAEQYDQPVLLRIGVADATELRDGFPKGAADLYQYHAVILDDVEAKFFTRDQLSLLQQFVSRRGGGFMMLGGQESFAKGDYERTPIASLLPVYVKQSSGPLTDGYRLVLTREGWLQPWVRLRATEPEERQRLAEMRPFRTLNRIERVKPGAAVLAEVAGQNGEKYPALVAQRFGKGQAAALLIGDVWTWGLTRPAEQPRDMEKAWRQALRWLVADVPGRVEVHTRYRDDQPHRPVQLDVSVSDPQFEPLDNATVEATVTTPEGKQVRLSAEPGDEPGRYYVTFVPRDSGAYRAQVLVKAPDGSTVGTRQVGWTAEPAADEFRELRPNRELLEQIAQQTGGQVLESDELDEFVAGLPNRKVPITEAWVYPLWHQPLIFLLAIGCVIAECGVRRWYGLA